MTCQRCNAPIPKPLADFITQAGARPHCTRCARIVRAEEAGQLRLDLEDGPDGL